MPVRTIGFTITVTLDVRDGTVGRIISNFPYPKTTGFNGPSPILIKYIIAVNIRRS